MLAILKRSKTKPKPNKLAKGLANLGEKGVEHMYIFSAFWFDKTTAMISLHAAISWGSQHLAEQPEYLHHQQSRCSNTSVEWVTTKSNQIKSAGPVAWSKCKIRPSTLQHKHCILAGTAPKRLILLHFKPVEAISGTNRACYLRSRKRQKKD